MPVHVGLYPNLDNLVYNQYRKYNKAGYPALRKEFTHFYFLPLFLASMLKVAWGTARSALPVSVAGFAANAICFVLNAPPKQPAILG